MQLITDKATSMSNTSADTYNKKTEFKRKPTAASINFSSTILTETKRHTTVQLTQNI
jgi:hypothetical protein